MVLFNSKISRTLLSYLFLNEKESLFVNEIVRKLDLDKRNLVKKLREFVADGLLLSEKKGNEVYYRLNRKYPLYREYKKIILKTYGIENQLKESLGSIDGISEAYIFGSYANQKLGPNSDIDVLIVGDHKVLDSERTIHKLERALAREINIVNISPQELNKKKNNKDQFINGIFNKKTIKLI